MAMRTGCRSATARLWRASGSSRMISRCPAATASRMRRLTSRVAWPVQGMEIDTGKAPGSGRDNDAELRLAHRIGFASQPEVPLENLRTEPIGVGLHGGIALLTSFEDLKARFLFAGINKPVFGDARFPVQ